MTPAELVEETVWTMLEDNETITIRFQGIAVWSRFKSEFGEDWRANFLRRIKEAHEKHPFTCDAHPWDRFHDWLNRYYFAS